MTPSALNDDVVDDIAPTYSFPSKVATTSSPMSASLKKSSDSSESAITTHTTSSSEASSEVETASESSLTAFEFIVDNFTHNLRSKETVIELSHLLAEELLDAYNSNSPKAMLHTQNILPSGDEQGRFLVVDLGGSTLRITVIDLLGKGKADIVASQQWNVANDLKVINYNFFDWIAQNVVKVLESGDYFDYKNDVIKVGMSWSFPFEQNHLNEAFIYLVSKGYELTEETTGKNLSDLLGDALSKYNVTIQMEAIVNDAVSVFLSGYFMHETNVGIVLGTGINASLSLNDVVVNAELGFFGNCFSDYASEFDLEVNEQYVYVKDTAPADDEFALFQPLEYMCAGRYISELLRLSLVKLIETGEVFIKNSQSALEKLKEPYSLTGEVLSNLYEVTDQSKLKTIYQDAFHQTEYDENDHFKIKQVIHAITKRGSILLSAALLAICRITEDNQKANGKEVNTELIKIGYVGSLLQYFHGYRDMVEEMLEQSTGDLGLPKIELIHINDSSVLGAAIAAGSHNLLNNK